MVDNFEVQELKRRRDIARQYLRSLSPEEKIACLMDWQERYYEMLSIRETNGGKPIPTKWMKWHEARHPAA